MLRKSLLLIFRLKITLLTVTVMFISAGGTVLASTDSGAVSCCPEEQYRQVLKLTRPYMCTDEVTDLQIALKRLGYYNGPVNGIFNRKTETAVKTFQSSCRLKPDGIVGRQTNLALSKIFELSSTHTSRSRSPKGQVELVIDIDNRTLTVYDNKKKFKVYDIAVGKENTPTPVGNWKITRKAMNWGTGFGTRWMGLGVPWGLYGIHGTNKPWSIGTEASKGCIRMFNHDVEELYPWVRVGTVVKIVGEVFPPSYEDRHKVHKGHKGTVVLLVQQGLAAEGYLKTKPDGVFGQDTENALKKLQKERGFEVTGQVDVDIWPVLGL